MRAAPLISAHLGRSRMISRCICPRSQVRPIGSSPAVVGAGPRDAVTERGTERELRALWRRFDQDRSGALDMWEFGLLLSHLGLLHHHDAHRAALGGGASEAEVQRARAPTDYPSVVSLTPATTATLPRPSRASGGAMVHAA